MDNNTEYRIADLAELGRRYEKQGILSRMKTLARSGAPRRRWLYFSKTTLINPRSC